jgi:hypothetical protein
MCNCNKGRSSYNANRNNVATRNTSSSNEMVKVQLMENSPVVFYGSFTGKAYKLKSVNDLAWVDKRDAENLKGVRGLRVFK